MASTTAPHPPVDYIKKVSEDVERYEELEKEAGAAGIQKFMDDHFAELIELSQHSPLRYTEMLTSGLELNPGLPAQTRERMKKLRAGVRRVVEEMAGRVENYKYKSAEEAVRRTRMTFLEREKTNALIEASKKIHTSAQAMKIAIEVFINLNNRIVAESGRGGDDRDRRRELALKNALVVCELLEFAIDYISTHGVEGIAEIGLIHRETSKEIEAMRQKTKALQEKAASLNDEVTLDDARATEAALDQVLKKWESQMKRVAGLEGLTNSMKELVPVLNLRRDNAVNHLEFFELSAVLKQAAEHIRLVEAAPQELGESLELMRLSPGDFLTLACVSAAAGE